MKLTKVFCKKTITFLSGISFLSIIFSPFPAAADNSREYHLDLIKETVLAAAGLSFTLAGSHLIAHVHAPDPASLNRNDVPGIDRMALDRESKNADNFSDIMLDISSFLPCITAASMLFRESQVSNSQVIADLVMYAESSLIISGLTGIAKGSFHRSRPYAYDPSVSLATRGKRDASLSFFSGHTSAAFNGAVFACSVFQRQHPKSKLIIPFWIFGLSAATATAIMRVEAGMHFPTDVLAGAVAGSFTGWLIPRLHEGTPKRFEVITVVNGAHGCGIKYHF